MTITEMKPERLESYVKVFLKAFGGDPWNEPWTEEIVSKRLDQFMKTGISFGLELEEDGEVIAMILGQYEEYYDGLRFFVQDFCCAKRGGGYGTKLIAEMERQLKAQGVVRVCLLTIHGNATEGYYQRRGYNTDEEFVWMYKEL